MQTKRRPHPSQKEPFWFFVLKWMKNGKKNSDYFFSYDSFCSQFSSILGHFLAKKKDAQCSDRIFCKLEFFFVRFLIFELWSSLYFTVVNSVLLNLAKNLEGFIAKYAVDAKLFRSDKELGNFFFKSVWIYMNVLKRMKNQFSHFYDFYFSSYGHFCIQSNWSIFDEFSL